MLRVYVVGLEPCNAPVVNRPELRNRGKLPTVEPGEHRTMRVALGILEGSQEIRRFE